MRSWPMWRGSNPGDTTTWTVPRGMPDADPLRVCADTVVMTRRTGHSVGQLFVALVVTLAIDALPYPVDILFVG